MSFFSKSEEEFGYVGADQFYFDSACQTLRPESVIAAQNRYYREFNACGDRVKYEWGKKVDREVSEARRKILDLLGKNSREYAVAFTLNTTYGINIVLNQIPAGKYSSVITSEIEHNSVFLPTISIAKRLGIGRKVLQRAEDGSLLYKPEDLDKAIVVVNAASNIDGRMLKNAEILARDAHSKGGILLIDAAQAFAHSYDFLSKIDFDALFFSGHKTYAPSLGAMVIKKTLLNSLENTFVGGGTVEDVKENSFTVISAEQEPFARLEAGLQNYGGIVGLNAALSFLQQNHSRYQDIEKYAEDLYQAVKSINGVHIINSAPSSILSFYHDKANAHDLAMYLSAQNIMARSGYFCCHYYLKEVKKSPPLLRISIALNNTKEQVSHVADTLTRMISNL